MTEKRAGDDGAAAQLEEQILTAKGWGALGAFDPAERSRSLDLLGFESQLVFPTFAATQFAGDDLELTMGGTRALNRAMNAFCADDDRLVAVASVPWLDPADTLALAEHALDDGAGALQLPSHPGKGVSPTHPDHDALWSMLGGARRAVHDPHRWRRPHAQAGVPRQRPAGQGLPRRWREPPRQGLRRSSRRSPGSQWGG